MFLSMQNNERIPWEHAILIVLNHFASIYFKKNFQGKKISAQTNKKTLTNLVEQPPVQSQNAGHNVEHD